MAEHRDPDAINFPPLETEDLRRNLQAFLDREEIHPISNQRCKIGNYQWGVYAFFDYDLEPIYVGQTNEQLRTRIRRHLTNQRTDAVAMSVLDPFEVFEIEIWPRPQFENEHKANREAEAHLDALENAVYAAALSKSRFGAVLNEKDPQPTALTVTVPPSYRGRIVSDEVYKIRSHPDFRIARRALTISSSPKSFRSEKCKAGCGAFF